MNKNMKQPIVFLLDFDGTMQGNIRPQIEEYNLITELNKIILNNKKIKYNTEFFHRDMMAGLLRPDLKSSLLKIKHLHPHIEFFIYTASQDEWANFILPKVCQYLNDTVQLINKPFFTRKHCTMNGAMKSIKKIKQEIQSSLRKKYHTRQESKFEIDSIYLVDNNYVLPKQELSYLIHCPTYDYKLPIDLLRNVDKHIVVKYYSEIADIVLNETQVHSYIEFMYKYYAQLFENILFEDENNRKELNDNYWSLFASVVTSYDLNHKANVIKMTRKLNSIK